MTKPYIRVYTGWDVSNEKAMILRGETEMYSSLRWGNCWSTPGEFEVHLYPTKNNLSLCISPFDVVELCKGKYPPRERFGIVLAVNYPKNSEGTAIVVRGKMLSALLGFRRVGEPKVSGTVSVPAVASALIKDTCHIANTASTKKRTFFGRETVRVLNNSVVTAEYDYEYDLAKTALEWLEEICATEHVGFWSTYDFEDTILAIGLEDFKANPGMANVQMGDWASVSVTKSIDSAVNRVVNVAENSTNFAQEIVVKGSRKGSRGTSEDIYSIEAPYLRSISTYNHFGGYEGDNDVESVEPEMSCGPYVYIRDYAVGDVCGVRVPQMGISAELPITSVTEVWEESYSVDVTFGEKQKGVFKKLKKEIKRR